MRQKIVILVLICVVLWGWEVLAQENKGLSGKEKANILKNLDTVYRNWWDMVYYISSREERDVFLQLKNNRERDVFIRTFWLQRDPTPGTEENEYKKEIEERFAYVNKYFSRGTSRPGWMTDPGKFYMILGKPSSISRYDNKTGLYPAQIWYYYGDPTLGLPTLFTVTFFKPSNTTEWKFYNPSVDGPAALLIKQGAIDEMDFEGLYNKIKELAPELAMPSITMIPNEIAPGYRPLLRNNIVISNIYESPRRKVNLSYATHFLNYKGYVDVESSVNYVESTHLVSVTRYPPFGLNFVNVSFKPTRISVGYDEKTSQYFFNFDVSVSLRKGETYVYEYKKKFDFYIEPNRVDKLKSNGIVIHDSFPVIPGQYKVMVYAMNSVGMEFTYFEKDIKAPPLDNTPVLATPIIGYKTELQSDNFFFTYRFGDKKLFVDPGESLKLKEKPLVMIGAYNLTRDMWEKGKVELVLNGLSERRKFQKTYGFSLNQYPYQGDLNILYRLGEDIGGLDPDYYELEVKLLDGAGKLRDYQKAQFGVSPLVAIANPMETFKQVRADNPYYFYYTLAQQFYNIGNIPEAAAAYARTIEYNPDFKEGLVAYLTVLNQQKKYTQVLVEVEKLKDDTQFAFDYNLVKATALYGMKDYNEALTHLEKANTIYDSDVRVLNLLGFTFLNLKDYQEALKAFAASLGLDDKQDFIKKTVEQVKLKMGSKSNANSNSQ